MKFNCEEKDGKMVMNLNTWGCWLGCAGAVILMGASLGAAVGLAKLIYRWLVS